MKFQIFLTFQEQNLFVQMECPLMKNMLIFHYFIQEVVYDFLLIPEGQILS